MTAKQGRAETGNVSSRRPDREQASREVAFRRAASHSRTVQFLKFALPAAAIAIAGSFAWPPGNQGWGNDATPNAATIETAL